MAGIMTPEERVKEAWTKLTLGPGWEKRLSALMADAVRAAQCESLAREREACCEAIRANCPACDGSGIGGYEAVAVPGVNPDDPYGEPIPVPDRQPYKCEYCGRIIAAIHARGREKGGL